MLIVEEIDQQFWTLATPKKFDAGSLHGTTTSDTKGEAVLSDRDNAAIATNLSQTLVFENDPDVAALNLTSSMRIRKFVLQMQTQKLLREYEFPADLLLKGTVQIGVEIHHHRYVASVSEGTKTTEGLVEIRSYQNNIEEVRRGIENLCMILTTPKDDSFCLPKAEGMFQQGGSAKRFGLCFPLSSLGARDLDSVWTLERVIFPVNRERNLMS